MTLAIDRLHQRLHSPRPIDAGRIVAWRAAFAAQDGPALAAGLVGDDEWLLIRRLRVATRWRADATEAEVGALWAGALRQAIAAALEGGEATAGCVRYAGLNATIADLLYRSALRETDRQWAWQAIGLVERAGIGSEAALAAGVDALLRSPERIWPVLNRLHAGEPDTAALSALLRALPATDWQRLFAACAQTAAYLDAVQTPPRDAAAAALNPAATPVDGADSADQHTLAASAAAQALLRWAAARALLVQRHGDRLAVLLAALAWPSAGVPAAAVRRRLRLAQQRLAEATVPRPAAAAPASARATGAMTAVDDGAAAAAARPAPRALPPLPEPARWLATAWGGALFWLARLPASGVFERLAQLEEVPADALMLLLQALAGALDVPDDDAAAAAFCGGNRPRAETPPAIAALARTVVEQWQAWLDEAAPELPAPRLHAVCRRSGRLRLEPGWIELHLALSSVDTAVRRLGLDLDPGWLPWLGCVLRIHYDDD